MPVGFAPASWIDGATLLQIEVDVLGWRPLPEESDASDPMTWNREKLEAELRRLCSD